MAHRRTPPSRLCRGFFGSLMDCFYCAGLWFSLPLTVWLANGGWIAILLHWQALSGAASLERATGRRELSLPPYEYS